MSSNEPSEEELRAALDEQLRNVSAEDVLLQSTATLVNLAARKLGLAAGPEERDLDQAKLSIDGARALLPLLPSQAGQQIKDAVSQLQMAYAREAGSAPGGEVPAGEAPVGAGPEVGAPGAQGARPGQDGGQGGTKSAGSAAGQGAPGQAGAPPPGARPSPEEAERERARSRIWTPPGS